MTHCKSKYGAVAVEAACAASEGVDPIAAWKASAAKIFLGSPSGEHKSCPKSAFLGLVESGEIAGVKPGKYMKSTATDNRKYAETALKLLREDEAWATRPQELWLRVLDGSNKTYNSQMHVVIALWNAKKFVGQAM